MKTSILLASVAAAGVAAWIIKKRIARNNQVENVVAKPQKHMTNVFSHAKTYANHADL